MNSIEHLTAIRTEELMKVLPFINGCKSILEIGAGTGHQSRELNARGFSVSAIEYAHPGFQRLKENQVWPVSDYDGHTLPFEDDSFDCIFSSNVLEHVPHLSAFQMEIHRTLKADGLAIHLMPSGAWRTWTTITHPPFVLRRLLTKFPLRKKNGICTSPQVDESSIEPTACPVKLSHRQTMWEKLRWYLLPERHGECGNFFTETYYFSRHRWVRFFQDHNWEVLEARPAGLFYTGCSLLGQQVSIPVRTKMAVLLGSACNIFVLRKASHA